MLLNIVLIVGVLAVIASWVVAVRLVKSDKFSGPVAGGISAESSRRAHVLAGSTIL